jgi:hypothetical protein
MRSVRGELRTLVTVLLSGLALACRGDDAPDSPDAVNGRAGVDTSRALHIADPQLFAVCDTLGALVDSVTPRPVLRTNGRFTGAALGAVRYGCHITAADTLQPDVAERPLAVVWRSLVARGWSLDQAYVADGPDGSMLGLRHGTTLCVLQHFWETGSDDERVPRPETPFHYEMVVECFREAARGDPRDTITDTLTR